LENKIAPINGTIKLGGKKKDERGAMAAKWANSKKLLSSLSNQISHTHLHSLFPPPPSEVQVLSLRCGFHM
jgi:hypothetical protein